MAHKSGMNSHSGYSLVELAVGVLIVGILILVIGWYITSKATYFRTASTESQIAAYDTYNKEIVTEGFDPASSPLDGVAPGTPQLVHRTSQSGLPGDVNTGYFGSSQTPRLYQPIDWDQASNNPDLIDRQLQEPIYEYIEMPTIGIGVNIRPGTGPQDPGQSQLEPPIVALSGTLEESDFPLSEIITANPDNPPGTLYVFDESGADPTLSSPRWDGTQVWTATSLPPVIRFMAIHPDGNLYSPSDVVDVTFDTSIDVLFARVDGSQSPHFTFYEVTGIPSVHGIELEPTIPVAGQIRYTWNGTEPTAASPAYSGPINPPLGVWGSDGTAQLRARAFPSGAQYSPGSILVVNLQAVAVQLEDPDMGISSGHVLRDGDSLTPAHSNPYASIMVRIPGFFEGLRIPNQAFTIEVPKKDP